ncbi:hypothetical protein CEXT_145921 [Caerostris extrusa]|uniref:Uncharacterized protein n=1 Tax=Caerostris extrusa TaxID=172846 RepID=A0AAV4SVV6_CAEEX|nr:hypothetical protein CEXT_145921 [Caerostris extrusa]
MEMNEASAFLREDLASPEAAAAWGQQSKTEMGNSGLPHANASCSSGFSDVPGSFMVECWAMAYCVICRNGGGRVELKGNSKPSGVN